MLPLRRPLTLHKACQVEGGNDVPIVQIKQSKINHVKSILLLPLLLPCYFPWFTDSWAGFAEASENARG